MIVWRDWGGRIEYSENSSEKSYNELSGPHGIIWILLNQAQHFHSTPNSLEELPNFQLIVRSVF